ncbi:pyrimidine utilization protein D [Methylobacterium sp. J-070]|uniref:pyrimidine utilization protein D n=1 Tax=Methylobacterium sp. J-070 TaxID=2836650 RepID=UPI001FBAE5E1|nr:pyrimidine utilization protein D [Methylobacterium sp. J-070]MCJ2053443.1 pyrimidine utilization protein D [Methylobacterium sp. J-070]
MHYVIHGRSEETAPTILLSAGLGGLGAYWKPQLAALGEQYRVVIYDHRGTGMNWEELPTQYAIAHMADDVLEILDQAGVRRCHFVGHALGGLVGLDLALREPDRLSSLVLVNAWAKVDSHTRRCFDARIALLEHGGAEAYLRAQPIFLYPAPWLSRHAERVTREAAEGVGHFQGAHNLRARLGALLAFDASGLLGGIQVPTLVAAARDDVLVPCTCSEDLARAIPASRLALAAEGGHAHSVTVPDRFKADLIDFLREATQASHPH